MKVKRIPEHLLAACYAIIFSVSAIGCLVTGWELNIASVKPLLFLCVLFSCVSSLLLYFRNGGWYLLLTSLGIFGILWQGGALWKQMQAFAYLITSHFSEVYGWSVIGSPETEEYPLVLIFTAFLIAVGTVFFICRRITLLLTIPTLVLPLFLCLITTDTLPEEIYLYLLLLGISMFILTEGTRTYHPEQFVPMTLKTILPTAAVLALLFILNPQANYKNTMEDFRIQAADWFLQMYSMTGLGKENAFIDSDVPDTENLRDEGPRSRFTFTVMQITSSAGGTVYLRGTDYDTYTGTDWLAAEERGEMFTAGDSAAETVTISTYGTRRILYVPYYAAQEIPLTGGCLENTENLSDYSFSFSRTPAAQSGARIDTSPYLTLPLDTYLWTEPLVKEIIAGAVSAEEITEKIGEYVRNSAVYDLSTQKMPDDCDDFAVWFLEESDTGYCVHFATAAAVLLRTAGIPARFVEGFMVSCTPDQQTRVTNQNGHAWAEYYDIEENVWRILEATPEDPDEQEAEISDSAEETDSPELPETPTEEPVRESPDTPSGSKTPDKPETGHDKTEPESDSVKEQPFRVPDWAKKLPCILAAISAVPMQGSIRIAMKRKKWDAGSPNEKALFRWNLLNKYAKRMKIRLPEELKTTALKAKFSQYTITEEELRKFDRFREYIHRKTGQTPWYRRWLYRWIYAIG